MTWTELLQMRRRGRGIGIERAGKGRSQTNEGWINEISWKPEIEILYL
jgi:hypothetical protein